jgi:hypothetical protein
MRGAPGSLDRTKATLAVLQKRGVIKHLTLQTEPAKPVVGQIEMRFCDSRRSERAQARRIAAEPIPVKHSGIEPVSLLGILVSKRHANMPGPRVLAPRYLCRANVDNRRSVLIFRGRHSSFVQAINMERRQEQSDEC